MKMRLPTFPEEPLFDILTAFPLILALELLAIYLARRWMLLNE